MRVSDYLDVGFAPKEIGIDKFEKVYFKNKAVQLNLNQYDINPIDITIEEVSFKEWKDNYDYNENEQFFDYITQEYQGKPELRIYLEGTADIKIDAFDDLYDADIVEYIKKQRGIESMQFKSKMMKQNMRKFREEDEGDNETKTLKAVEELISMDDISTEDEQGKFLELLKGIVFADKKHGNAFQKKINDFTSTLKIEDFKESKKRSKIKKSY